MAKRLQNTIPTLMNIISLITILSLVNISAAHNDGYHKNLSPKTLGLEQEQLTHLHFYFHDTASGPKPTAVLVAKANSTNSLTFGFVVVMDDPLTVGPEPNSKLVGRAQGTYTFASQSDLELLMVYNYVFTEGKYNGSTLSVLGHNAVFRTVREMPIVGGSGLFRFARGYVESKTHTLNTTTGDSIIEHNVYVLHY